MATKINTIFLPVCVQVVCPHGNATDEWLQLSAVDDPLCACNVYGSDGLALSINHYYFPSLALNEPVSDASGYMTAAEEEEEEEVLAEISSSDEQMTESFPGVPPEMLSTPSVKAAIDMPAAGGCP
jgi:hypothetical protein